ncbi:MAG: penicillin-binding transpeptidase domain-containing protein [Lentimicrobiaceae bacterium]|nr:penicillin-binding transpeptidase domain-containing protein [Lentimicrobiaceae bacterium]
MRKFNGGIIFTYFVLIVIGIAAVYRIVHLSVSMGEYYKGVIPEDSTVTVEGRTFRIEKGEEIGKRGNILSDDGTILLSTVFVYDLYWRPSYVYPQNDSLYLLKVDSLIKIFYKINPKKSIAEYTKLVKEDYMKYRESYQNAKRKTRDKDKAIQSEGRKELEKLKEKYVIIQISNIEQPSKWVRQRAVNEIDSLFKGWKGSSSFRGGCQKDQREVRRQLTGGYPSSVLGILKKDKGEKQHSYRGIEGYYDSLLAGETISKRILKVNDMTVRLKENKRLSPAKGYSIVTTIDNDIQRLTRDALRKRLLDDPTADWGCAIVMEVKTGQIKAIVNLDKNRGGCEEITDHSTTESFEPGSTFKLMTLLAALESGKITPDSLVTCEKGTFTLKKAFADSDNKGMFDAAKRGYKDIYAFGTALTKMRLHKDLKIETANAKTPRLESITKREIDYDRMTHGYSIKVPPIYMLAYYNAVANNGVYVKPTLIKAMTAPNGTVIYNEPDTIHRQICSPKTIRLAQSCLEAVVVEGTARRAQDSRFKTGRANKEEDIRPLIAGKTGTAFIYDEKSKGYLKGIKNSSFIGYFPTENPKFTCLVLVSKTYLDAASIAVPVCKEIAEKLYNYYDEISLSKQEDVKKKNFPTNEFAHRKDMETFYKELGINTKPITNENEYVAAVRNADSTIVFRAKDLKTNLLSALRKATAKDAVNILEKQGYKVQIRGIGKVKDIVIQNKTAIVYLSE